MAGKLKLFLSLGSVLTLLALFVVVCVLFFRLPFSFNFSSVKLMLHNYATLLLSVIDIQVKEILRPCSTRRSRPRAIHS